MSGRRRPLHTFGVSFVAIAKNAYSKALDLNGPLGSVANRIAKAKIVRLAIPFVSVILYQCLIILSFADDHILAVEIILETIFPPSKHIFNKIDEFVKHTETFPGKLDDALNNFSSLIHRVPSLDWTVGQGVSLLNVLMITLSNWGLESTREKEISIDINCNEQQRVSGILEKSHCCRESYEDEKKENGDSYWKIQQQDKSETEEGKAKPDVVKSTYKEVLEKGTRDEAETDHESNKSFVLEEKIENLKSEIVANEEENKNADENQEAIVEDDQILELFESAWLMKPARKGK